MEPLHANPDFCAATTPSQNPVASTVLVSLPFGGSRVADHTLLTNDTHAYDLGWRFERLRFQGAVASSEFECGAEGVLRVTPECLLSLDNRRVGRPQRRDALNEALEFGELVL